MISESFIPIISFWKSILARAVKVKSKQTSAFAKYNFCCSALCSSSTEAEDEDHTDCEFDEEGFNEKKSIQF